MATELYVSGESAHVSRQLKQSEQHGGFLRTCRQLTPYPWQRLMVVTASQTQF